MKPLTVDPDLNAMRAKVIADLKEQVKRLQAAISTLEALNPAPAQGTRFQGTARGPAGRAMAQLTMTALGGPESSLSMAPPPRTLVEAAELALRDAKKPLGMRDLIKGIQARGYRAGDDPGRLRNTLAPGLRMAEKAGRNIVNKGGGIYALREWGS